MTNDRKTMNKKLMTLMLGTLAMGCFSACSSEDDVLQSENTGSGSDLRTVTAGIESDATRIALGESDGGKTKVLWSKDDAIALHCGDYPSVTFNRIWAEGEEEEAATATFEGTVPSDWTWTEADAPYFQYSAFPIPGDPIFFQSGKVEDLSAWMEMRADASGLFAGEGDGVPHVTFGHRTSVIKIQLTHPDFKVYGNFVSLWFMFGNDYPMLFNIGKDSEYTTLSSDENGTLTAYFVIPVEAYREKYGTSTLSGAGIAVNLSEGNSYPSGLTPTYDVDLSSVVGKELAPGQLIKVTRGEEDIILR